MTSNPSRAQSWPVPITAEGAVSVATQLFRLDGQLHLTLMVKAAFSLVPNDLMKRVAPPPIVVQDVYQGPIGAQSLISACDLVPTRARTDVWLTGHAYPPGSRPATTSITSLSIYRGDKMLLHKSILIRGDLDASGKPIPFTFMPLHYERALCTEENPMGVDPSRRMPNFLLKSDPKRTAGFGPLSSHWPARRQYLEYVDPDQVDVAFPNLPAGFDVRYYQAAPLDQQLPYLAGDETIVLEGLHPQIDRLTTYLPRITARIQLLSSTKPETPHSVPVHLDTLSIDADWQMAYVVFRGYLPVNEEIVPTLRALAAIDTVEAKRDVEPQANVVAPNEPARATSASNPPPAQQPAPIPSKRPAKDRIAMKVQKETFMGVIKPEVPTLPFGAPSPLQSSQVPAELPKVEKPREDWGGQTIAGSLQPDAAPLPFPSSSALPSPQANTELPKVAKPKQERAMFTFVGTLQPDTAPLPFAPSTSQPLPQIPIAPSKAEKRRDGSRGQTFIGTITPETPALPFAPSSQTSQTSPTTQAGMAPPMQDLAPPIAVKAHNLSIGELMASHAPIASVTPPNPPAMAMVASPKVKARGKKKRFKALGTAFLAAVEACAQNDGASK